MLSPVALQPKVLPSTHFALDVCFVTLTEWHSGAPGGPGGGQVPPGLQGGCDALSHWPGVLIRGQYVRPWWDGHGQLPSPSEPAAAPTAAKEEELVEPAAEETPWASASASSASIAGAHMLLQHGGGEW